MRHGLIWIVVLVALAGVGLLLFGGGQSGGGGGEIGPGRGDGGQEAENSGPTLTTGTGGPDASTPRVPADLRGRGMIQGTVTRDGAPVAAAVELRHLSEIDPQDPFKGGIETLMIARMLDAHISGKAAIGRHEAGADGRFVFRSLAPGLYEIRATAGDGVTGFGSASIPAFGARVEATVEIPAGGESLVGRIVYADGHAFRGMAVATSAAGDNFAMLFGGGKAHPTPTDAKGHFEIGGLTPGKYQISAILPGVMRAMGPPITLPYTGEYTLTIQSGAITLRGKVLRADDEQPIPGATIFGGGGEPSSNFAIFSTRSAADGTFTMTLPAGRSGGVFVKAEGFASQTIDFRGSEQEVVVTMLPLAKLTGRVVAKEDGRPLPGITVFAMGERGRGMPPVPTTAVTGADGRYAMDGVPPGAVKVHALGAGWASIGLSGQPFGETNTPYVVELEPGGEGTLDLEATAAGRVKGRVLDENGRGVPGVVVDPAANDANSGFTAFYLGAGANYGTVVTDAEGAYEIDVLVPGTRYRVSARAPEHPEVQSEPFVAAAGEVQTIDLHLKAPRWLEVIVTDSRGGGPVAGATVLAVSKDNPGASIRLLTGGGVVWTTGNDGHVRLGPLPEGALTLGVRAPGYVKIQDREVAAGETSPLAIELQRGLVIAGRVVVPEGVPIQAVRVSVQNSSPRGGWFQERPAVQDDGTWKVDSIEEAGSYEIHGRAQWQDRRLEGKTKAEAGTTDVVLVLTEKEQEERNRVEVVVVDQDGKPVPAGQVQVWRFGEKGGTSTNRSRLSAGKAVFGDLNADGELWVEVYGLLGGLRGATIEGPVTIQDGRIDVRLPPPASIAGRITAPSGEGVAGVRVSARAVHPRSGTQQAGQEHGEAVSMTDGRFELRGLGPLDYTLSFRVPTDYAPVAAEVVHAGRKDVAVALRAGLRASLVVIDYAGKPVQGARIWCYMQNGGKRGIRSMPSTDSEGLAVLTGLDPNATYALTAHPPESRKDLKNLELSKWSPGDGTFTLVRAFSIAGTVVDQHGTPLENVSVQARREGSKSWNAGYAQTDGSGTFRLESLEAGRYDLRAYGRGVTGMMMQPSPGSEPAPGVVTARAGATGVKLVLDLGLSLRVHVEGLEEVSLRGIDTRLQAQDGGRPPLQASYSGHGEWTFQGLSEGTPYRLWIGGLPGGRYVLEQDVRAQEQTLSVQARQGGTITGTIRLPAGAKPTRMFVTCHDKTGLQRQTSAGDDGRFTLTGLPDGTWTVTVQSWDEARGRWMGQVSATTGSVVTVELKKQ